MKPPSSGEQPEPAPKIGTPYKYVPRPTDDEVLPKGRGLRIFGLTAGAAIALLAAGYGIIRLRAERVERAVQAPSVRLLSESQWTNDSDVSIAPAFSID